MNRSHRAAALAVIALAALCMPIDAQETVAERIARILSEVPLIDGHNDLPGKIREVKTPEGDVGLYDLRSRTAGDTDLPRLREGLVGAQFWSVHVDVEDPAPAKQQLEQIEIAHRIIEAYPDALEFAASASDIQRVFGAGKIASLLGIEGGHVIENSLGALRAFYRWQSPDRAGASRPAAFPTTMQSVRKIPALAPVEWRAGGCKPRKSFECVGRCATGGSSGGCDLGRLFVRASPHGVERSEQDSGLVVRDRCAGGGKMVHAVGFGRCDKDVGHQRNVTRISPADLTRE